jgi:sigma-E factor negative regulatory protein RseA
MKEKLSALIDGELGGEDLRAHLGRLRADPELRNAWDAYHLIGDALRGQISPEIAARVVARLREEPTVLAPRPGKGNPLGRFGWYAMSAAASVAAVAFVVWTASPGWRAEEQLAGGPAAATAAAPVASLVSIEPHPEVENYLLAHQPYSHRSAMQGIATYVRTNDERGAARK